MLIHKYETSRKKKYEKVRILFFFFRQRISMNIYIESKNIDEVKEVTLQDIKLVVDK